MPADEVKEASSIFFRIVTYHDGLEAVNSLMHTIQDEKLTIAIRNEQDFMKKSELIQKQQLFRKAGTSMSENTNEKTQPTADEKRQIIRELLERGKKEEVLTYRDVMDSLEHLELDADQIEKIIDTLNKSGVEIVEDFGKELAEIEISRDELQDLSIPEGININDHVKMYLKEIGKVPLLDNDEEIEMRRKWLWAMKRLRKSWQRRI